MSSFTPGPWLIAGEDRTFVYALGPQGTNVFWASVQAAGPERAEEAEKAANARLIAAAPTLLEVAKLAELYALNEAMPTRAQLLEAARAAIALATSANLKEPQQ
jgi:hypothetical protein